MSNRVIITGFILWLFTTEIYATDPKLFFEQAQTAFEKEEYDYAYDLFEKYLSFAPEGEYAPEAWYMLGECLFNQEEYPDALLSYQTIIDMYPESAFVPKAYNRIGDCFWKIDDKDKAYDAYNQTIKRFPNTAEAEYAKLCISELSGILTGETITTTDITVTRKNTANKKRKGSDEITLGEEINMLEKAKALFKAKEYQKAREIFQEFITEFPKSKYIHYAKLKIGETYYYEDKYRNALVEYQKVITEHPDSKYIDYAIYSAGWCYFRLKEYKKAQDMFNRLLKEYPESNYLKATKKILIKVSALLEEEKLEKLLSEAKQECEKGDLYAAKEVLQQIIRDYPNSSCAKKAGTILAEVNQKLADIVYTKAKSLYDEAQSQLNKGNVNKAIQLLNKIIIKYPESEYSALAKTTIEVIKKKQVDKQAEVVFKEAEEYLKEGKSQEAYLKYQEVVNKYPDSKYIHDAKAKINQIIPTEEVAELYKQAVEYLGNEDYYSAIEKFQKILLEYPDSDYEVLAKKGIEEASECLKTQRMTRLFEIAQRYYALGDYEKAKRIFENITQEYPGTTYAEEASKMVSQLSGVEGYDVREEYRLAQYYYEEGKLEAALEQFKKIIDLYPQTRYARAAKGTIAIIQEKLNNQRAKELYDEARMLQEKGNYSEAIEEYCKILEEYPKAYWTPYAQYSKAEALYAQQKYIEAQHAWQKLIDSFPGCDLAPHALYHIAECYEKLKDYKNAAQTYLKLQDMYPESIYAKGELGELIKEQAARLKAKAETSQ